MMKLCKAITLMWALVLVACHATPDGDGEILTAEIRNEMNGLTILPLSDEIEAVSYVPLQVTGDDDSLIDAIAEYAITSHSIYVLPVQKPRIVQFDRQGRFIKTLVAHGQGPGELTEVVARMQADEKKNRLYLFGINQTAVYTLEGEFIENLPYDYMSSFQQKIAPDRFASIAFPFRPFEGGSFGLGIFTASGEIVAMKNDFYSPLVPREKSGFTVRLAAAFSQKQQAVLFKTGSNDTVFRMADDRILPALVLKLKNPDKEVIRSLDTSDFSSLREPVTEDGSLFVADLFETPRRYYFRLRHNLDHYVTSVDKKTGKTAVEKCDQPGTLYEMAATNLLLGMLGTRSYGNFPVWGRMEGDELVQVTNPYEINFFKESGTISIPAPLDTNEEEGNPVFIFYKLRK